MGAVPLPGSTAHAVAPQPVGSSRIRDQTCVSCTGRQTLYHWATREPLHDSYIHETGRVSPSFFVFHDLGLVFKSTGQLFWRMFFHLGSSGVSSWLGSGHAFQARRPQKSCGVISLCLIKRYMVPAVLFLELLTPLVKMISATFLSVKFFHPICN